MVEAPRAVVEYSTSEVAPHRVKAHFSVTRVQPLTIGQIVLRGNFQTKAWVIEGELKEAHVVEGAKLTTASLADGARRLRSTGLFDAVNIDLPEIENRDNTSLVVNAIDGLPYDNVTVVLFPAEPWLGAQTRSAANNGLDGIDAPLLAAASLGGAALLAGAGMWWWQRRRPSSGALARARSQPEPPRTG